MKSIIICVLDTLRWCCSLKSSFKSYWKNHHRLSLPTWHCFHTTNVLVVTCWLAIIINYSKSRILERLLVPTNFLVYHSRLARFKFKLVYTLQQREILPFDFFFLFFSFQTIRYVLFRYSFKCFFGVINRIMVMQWWCRLALCKVQCLETWRKVINFNLFYPELQRPWYLILIED